MGKFFMMKTGACMHLTHYSPVFQSRYFNLNKIYKTNVNKIISKDSFQQAYNTTNRVLSQSGSLMQDNRFFRQHILARQYRYSRCRKTSLEQKLAGVLSKKKPKKINELEANFWKKFSSLMNTYYNASLKLHSYYCNRMIDILNTQHSAKNWKKLSEPFTMLTQLQNKFLKNAYEIKVKNFDRRYNLLSNEQRTSYTASKYLPGKITQFYHHGNSMQSTTNKGKQYLGKNNYQNVLLNFMNKPKSFHTGSQPLLPDVTKNFNKKALNKFMFLDTKLPINKIELLKELNLNDKKIIYQTKIYPKTYDTIYNTTKLVSKSLAGTNKEIAIRMKKYEDLQNNAILKNLVMGKQYKMIANYYAKEPKPFSINSRLWKNHINTIIMKMNEAKNRNYYSNENMGLCSMHLDNKNDEKEECVIDEQLLPFKSSLYFKKVVAGIIKFFRFSTLKPNNDNTAKLKTTHYDFTVKSNKLSKLDNNILIERRKPFVNLNQSYADTNIIAMLSDFRYNDQLRMYNISNDFDKRRSERKDTEALRRFCHVLRMITKMMVEINSAAYKNRCNNELDTDTSNAFTQDKAQVYSIKSNETCAINVFPVASKDDGLRCKLFFVMNGPDNIHRLSNRYLDFKINSNSKFAALNQLQLNDMEINIQEAEDENKQWQENDSNHEAIHDKCMALNLKIKIPFSLNLDNIQLKQNPETN